MADVQMDIYEDMFKEITKKIYGQDTSSSSSEDRRFVGQDAYKMVEEGLSMIDSGDVSAGADSFGEPPQPADDDPWVTSDETISWTTSKIGSYNADKKLFKCQECESVGLLSSVAEHWLGTHADVKVFQCPQCPYASAWARCIRIHLSRQHNVVAEQQQATGQTPWKESPVLEEVTSYLGRLKAAADKAEATVSAAAAAVATANAVAASTAAAAAAAAAISESDEFGAEDDPPMALADTETQTAQKRFNCSYCPYATDRRDLYTRHENIHKDDKPFQCDICQKQFNRADHVKKHYTRMHREHKYCLNRVKRDPYGKPAVPQPRVTLYSGDPPPLEPETQIIVSQTLDVQPLTSTPIMTASPIVLDDQQQQSVVNIAVVNFNEQTGTHTIQIPIPTSQIKPVMFAPETILTVDPIIGNGSSMMTTTTTTKTPMMMTTAPMMMSSAPMMITTTPMMTTTTPTPKSKSTRKNVEKRYRCTFCSWSGVDNWCLKRHLNTHMKPYECVFCEYKAARAERLANHMFKVHSKIMCCRCSYVAQDQDDLYAHQSENNHKSMRSRRTQTSPTPSSPDRTEENADKNDDVIVVWPMSSTVDSQNNININ